MSQLTNVARKEARADLTDEVSFIDCDTHFLVMSALESLAQTYPRQFQLIVKDDVIRFLYEGRVIHRSRVGEDIVGSSSHGRLDLDIKVETTVRRATNDIFPYATSVDNSTFI